MCINQTDALTGRHVRLRPVRRFDMGASLAVDRLFDIDHPLTTRLHAPSDHVQPVQYSHCRPLHSILTPLTAARHLQLLHTLVPLSSPASVVMSRHLFAPVFLLVLLAICLAAAAPVASSEPSARGLLPNIGVCLSGMEYGHVPGTPGDDYAWPTADEYQSAQPHTRGHRAPSQTSAVRCQHHAIDRRAR